MLSVVSSLRPTISFVKPLKSCERITPEFPLAPLNEPLEIAFERLSIVGLAIALTSFAADIITETVIDVAKDAAIGAAIVAAFGGAPVVAVAAGTAVISWGGDVVFKKITKAVTGEEKGVTEFVSDTVLDLAEGAKKVVSNALGGAAKAVKGWFCAPKFSFGW